MMRRILPNWIWLASLPVALTTTSCNRKASSGHDLDLLTSVPWKYEKAGFDSDEDGIFDALDPSIAGCEKDNEVIFRADGTGCVEDGQFKCKPSDPDSLPFSWSFQDNDSTIYFQEQYYKVKTLSSKEFEIYADQKLGGVNTRYTIVFTH